MPKIGVYHCRQSGKFVALEEMPGSDPLSVKVIAGVVLKHCNTFEDYWEEIKAHGGTPFTTTKSFEELCEGFARTMKCLMPAKKV